MTVPVREGQCVECRRKADAGEPRGSYVAFIGIGAVGAHDHVKDHPIEFVTPPESKSTEAGR